MVGVTSEKDFENKIKAWLVSHGCYMVKFFANGYTKRGVPDILASVNGFFVGIETKAQNGRPTDLQIYNVRKIRESGGFAWVVYPSGWPKVEKALLDLLDISWDGHDFVDNKIYEMEVIK